MQLIHTPNWTVIRLPDGRAAVRTNNVSRGILVQFDAIHGTRLPIATDVEVLAYPVELAHDYLIALQREPLPTEATR